MRRRRRKPDPPQYPVTSGAYAVVAGRRFDIRSVSLHGGQFHFTAWREGPSEAVSGYVTIFGSDGIGICQAEGEFDVPAAPEGSIIRYDINLRMTKTEMA